MQPTKSIAVIGLGNWGLALSQHLARRGHAVVAWTRDAQIQQSITGERRHPEIFKEIEIHRNIEVTLDLNRACLQPIVVYALPSSSLSQVVPQMQVSSATIFVSTVKGFERESRLTPLDYYAKHVGENSSRVVISGPSFALDVMHQRLCSVVAASTDIEVAKLIAEIFAGDSMRVYTSIDPIGVEVGGAVKNIIALAAGLCDGMNFGESARAGLITRGLAEMMRLAEVLGANRFTLTGLSGLGDLIMTATSLQSRNYLAGYRIGRGESLNNVLASLGSVVESIKTTPIVVQIARESGIEMPITEMMMLIINGEITATDAYKQLLQRPLKSE